MTKFVVIHIFGPTWSMYASFKVHFSCVFLFSFFCFVVVMFGLVHDVETVFLLP